MDLNQFSIVHKEVNSQPRTIKETMFIWVQDPPLNRNLGKYQLPHIWDQLLHASPTLQHKPSQPTNQFHNYLNPLLVPPPFLNSLLPTTWWGGVPILFPMVSTHVYPKYPPPYLQQVLHQCHLDMFLHFILLV